jgi:effector-binding domain-containing protein
MRESEMQAVDVMQFLYDGCDESDETVFTLDIAIPVDGKKDIQAPFIVKETPEFRCASIEYKGGMSGIGEGYMELKRQMSEAGLEPNELSREVYTYFMDGESPENITELQIGIR